MFAKKLSYFTVSSLFMTSALATTQSDLQLNVGYTEYSNYSFTGLNLGLSYLYSILENQITPVVGGGINSYLMKPTSYGSDSTTLNSYDGVIKAGVKFKIGDNFNLFALLNAGYAFYTSFPKRNHTLENTSSFGSSIIGTYNVTESMNVGLGYTYNRRNMKEKDNNFNSYIFFHEASLNVILGYSF